MHVYVNKKKFELFDCDTFQSRFMGLMFIREFDYCMMFKKCSSIHTFFMKTNIDVVMTDKNNNVLFVFKNLKPWKIITPKKGVYSTFEFPAGTITSNIKKIKVGE